MKESTCKRCDSIGYVGAYQERECPDCNSAEVWRARFYAAQDQIEELKELYSKGSKKGPSPKEVED